MSVFFTSDLHFGHANIIKYCKRPFSNVEEMDEALIANYNSLVGNNDIVYIIGDFSLAKKPENYARRLKGNKTLIWGNHDYITPELRKFFKEVTEFKQIRWGGEKITLCHYALRVWNKSHHGAWNLHGHSHGNLPAIGKQLDVGVDVHNYFPISFEDVKKYMDKRQGETVDHHEMEDM